MAVEVEDDVRCAEGDALAEAPGDVVHQPRALGDPLAAADVLLADRLARRSAAAGHGGHEAELELGQRHLGRVLRHLPGDERLAAALHGVALVLVADDPAVVRKLAGEDLLDVRPDVPLAVALTRRVGAPTTPGYGVGLADPREGALLPCPASGRAAERPVLGVRLGVEPKRRRLQLAVGRVGLQREAEERSRVLGVVGSLSGTVAPSGRPALSRTGSSRAG